MPLDEIQQAVLALCRPPVPVPVAADRAIGMVAAEPVRATAPLPAFATSATDGYALRADDCREPGAVLEVAMASGAEPAVVGPGEALRIMTGAPLPAGADAVCPLEQVEASEHVGRPVVRVAPAVTSGDHIRSAGEDVAEGDLLVAPGEALRPSHAGLLAVVGPASLLVHPRPRVGVVSTGDEGAAATGGVGDTTRPTLLAMAAAGGAEAVDLGTTADEEDDYRRVIGEAAAAGCHLLMSAGGIGFGDHDVVARVLTTADPRHGRAFEVALEPGTPLASAVFGDPPLVVLGLPGDPVAAVVSFELFARPAIRLLAGHDAVHRPSVTAQAARPLRRGGDGKTHVLPVRVHGGDPPVAEPAERLGSHIMTSLGGAQALAVVPDGEGERAGDLVRCLVLEPETVLAVMGD